MVGSMYVPVLKVRDEPKMMIPEIFLTSFLNNK